MRFFPLKFATVLFACSIASCGTIAAPLTLAQRCAAASADDLVEIKTYEQGLISACPPEADEDCIYNLTTGQTFSAGTPDLNADGLPDQIAKNLGSNYGSADITHYLGFVQCGDGTSIKVLEGDFKSLTVPEPVAAAWPDLAATRECAVPGKDDAPPQHVKLVFNQTTFLYEEVPKVDPQSVCSGD